MGKLRWPVQRPVESEAICGAQCFSLPSRSSYCLIIRLSEHQSVAATTVVGNTVGGNLQDNNNTGATQVFNNLVDNNLRCQQDSVITGGGNCEIQAGAVRRH